MMPLVPDTSTPASTRQMIWIDLVIVTPPNPPGSLVPVGGRDKEGWYRTGDLASVDRSGRLRLEGREDDMVRVDGKRVALGEVEACIETLPKVRAAQAMVLNDPLGGPVVIARVVLKDKARVEAEAIIDHCAKHLSPHKVPRRIEFCKTIG